MTPTLGWYTKKNWPRYPLVSVRVLNLDPVDPPSCGCSYSITGGWWWTSAAANGILSDGWPCFQESEKPRFWPSWISPNMAVQPREWGWLGYATNNVQLEEGLGDSSPWENHGLPVLQNRLWLWQCSRLLGTCTFVDVYNVYCISSSGMCQKLWYYLPYLYMNTFHILHIFTLSTTSHLSCCEQTGIPIVPGSWGVNRHQ